MSSYRLARRADRTPDGWTIRYPGPYDRPRLIGVSGGIGIGKSYAMRMYGGMKDVVASDECTDQFMEALIAFNHALKERKSDTEPISAATALQMRIVSCRIERNQDCIRQAMDKGGVAVVMERNLLEDNLLFARKQYEEKMISKVDWESYLYLFCACAQQMPFCDGMIVLDTTREQAIANVRERDAARDEEPPCEYVGHKYDQWQEWQETYARPAEEHPKWDTVLAHVARKCWTPKKGAPRLFFVCLDEFLSEKEFCAWCTHSPPVVWILRESNRRDYLDDPKEVLEKEKNLHRFSAFLSMPQAGMYITANKEDERCGSSSSLSSPDCE